MALSTQHINQGIDSYLEGLVAFCVSDQGEDFAERVRDHFYEAVLETVVEKLDAHQFAQIENLDPAAPAMVTKIQQLATQIPGLFKEIQIRLYKDAMCIKQTSRIPDFPS